ncbi:hypothetical protein [Actibacterium sp. MT2.3-13A]|uniref:hypothetical protein n=1 Tax=Actibacterium sp. MT2.3-13A TaxID=2828332 RepID=UPI001BAC2DC2|nr:hypothetical protein [Actibacterium sp. MT2.3-13A]
MATADPARRLVLFDDIEKALAARPGAPVLVLLSAPARSLLGAMQAGTRPSAALRRWMAAAEAQLAVLRRARRHIIALEHDAPSTDPQGCAEMLAARFGARFAAPAAGAVPAPDAPLLALMAEVLLDSDPRARALADEIEAMLACAQAPLEIGAAQIDRAFAALQEQDTALAELEMERELLRDGMAQGLEQLDRATVDTRLEHAATEAAARQMAALNDTRLLRESVLGAALLERAALLEAREAEIAALKAQAQAAAETHAGESAALRARLDAQAQDLKARQDELEAARSELEAVYASRSWKVTSPMRVARRGLGKG